MNVRSCHTVCVIFIVSVMLALVTGCVTTRPDHKTPVHTWGGEVTGDILGNMTLKLRFKQINKNTKSVTGRIIFNIDSVIGAHGSGRINGRLNGEIRAGILHATFSGEATVTDGVAFVNGSLEGPMSFSSGQGDWHLRTNVEARDYKGTWNIIRQ